MQQDRMSGILDELISGPLRLMERLEQEIFRIRLTSYWGDVVRPLEQLYGRLRGSG